MKKILFLIFSCFILLQFPLFIDSTAYAENKEIYAKITSENCYFYSLPDENDSNILFKLPNSYFVKLLSNQNDNFYYVEYGDIFGYVKKHSVVAMKGIPKNPYAISSFRIFSLEGLGLYKKATMDSEKLTTIPYLCEDLIFYGVLAGDHVIPDKSNEWYFAKFTQSSNFGYVYSVFCDKLPVFTKNNETFEIISSPLFSKDTSNQQLSSVAMTFIIIGVSLPCLIVLYLLIKPSMIKEKITRAKPRLKAKGKNDYFEFDESDLN